MKKYYQASFAAALSCLVLVSCAAPKVLVLDRPLPDSPAGQLAEIESASRRQLARDGLLTLYRKDPVEALRELHRLQKHSGDSERLVALAHLCGRLAAERVAEDPEFAAGCYLDAARLSLPAALEMAPDGVGRELRLIYNESCAELVVLLHQRKHEWTRETRLAGPLTSHRLSMKTGARGLVSPEAFDDVLIANRIGLEHAQLARRRHDGVGGSLIARKVGEKIDRLEAQFVPSAGLLLPLNASIDFSGESAELALRDMNEVEVATIAGRRVPLAAEWTAVLAYLYQYAPTAKAGFEAMIKPVEFDVSTDLFELSPYRKDKIPVVFVHGLMSSPETWIQMIAALGSDPLLRKRYQFLVFRYPSGYSIARNAAALRSKLADYRHMAEARGGVEALHRMVLVGHSMGGNLSSIQIRSSDDQVRKLYFQKPLDQIEMPADTREQLRQIVVFEPEPSIERAIFIAAPHRGSSIASNPIGEFGSRLIHLPADIYAIGISLTQLERLPGLTSLGDLTFHSRPDSIKSLRPDSEFLSTVVELPVSDRITYHTIAGQANQGAPITESTDKVVPYWSSHLDGAASEKLVDAIHTTITNKPDAIEEVRRLLYLHLGRAAPEPLPPVESPAASQPVNRHHGRP